MSSAVPKSEEVENQHHEEPDIRGDRLNFLILTVSYILQGAIFGLAFAIPLVLQKRNVTYQDQAIYNFVSYSYSFKILWAPIVDSIHWPRLGRRKTWVVPVQYFIGLLLLIISLNLESLLGTEDGTRKPNVRLLTITFSACIFFSSTQDIAIDGWSLTMLQKKNIGYSATSQSVGITTGFFLAHVGFLTLDSKDFCNLFRSTPQDYGLVTFADFIFYWALMYLITTTLVLLFKKEDNYEFTKMCDEQELSIGETYQHLWKILKIPSVQKIGVFMLTWHIVFGPITSVASLKILDAGIRRDIFALLSVPSFPFQLFLSFLLNRYLTGPRPMNCFLTLFVLRSVNSVVYAAFIFFISQLPKENGQTMPTWCYWPLVCFYNLDNITEFILTTVMSAFFARVSDPRFGGVYLTLLNCVNNTGASWPSTTCLWLVELITIKSCTADSKCHTVIDGFYLEVLVCTLIGVLWLIFWAKKCVDSFGDMDVCTCRVERRPTTAKDTLLVVNSVGEIENKL